MNVSTSVGTSNWIAIEGHDQVQPHMRLQWLRVAAWAQDPHISGLNHSAKVSDLLLSSGLAVQQQRQTGFQSFVNPVHLRKDKHFPHTKIHNTTESFFDTGNFVTFCPIIFPCAPINFVRGADGKHTWWAFGRRLLLFGFAAVSSAN